MNQSIVYVQNFDIVVVGKKNIVNGNQKHFIEQRSETELIC